MAGCHVPIETGARSISAATTSIELIIIARAIAIKPLDLLQTAYEKIKP
jgi:hypothetical protein